MSTQEDFQVEAQQDSALRPSTIALASVASAALAACGGGSSSDPTVTPSGGTAQPDALVTTGMPSRSDAWRFVSQATMGPSETDVSFVMKNGYTAWLNQQMNLPKNSALAYYRTLTGNDIQIRSTDYVTAAWWKNALTAKDQLRQRVAFALSEIIVISMRNMDLGNYPIMAAAWLDMLYTNAFGNYRTLIEDVIRHPAMGRYLSHFANIRPDSASGRIPDQNFARELIQLFTIGLVQLDDSGNVQMTESSEGKQVPIKSSTSSATDIAVLSHVFTGLALDGNNENNGGAPYTYGEFPAFDKNCNSAALTVPMKDFSGQHATQDELKYTVSKVTNTPQASVNPQFLGSAFTMGATTTDSIKSALDLLFGHPNLAPFIAKQMIMRLVTSNPSAGYVYRCTQAFRNSGHNIGALVRAILLDDDARKIPTTNNESTYYGKLREPLLRVTALFRAFGITGNTDYNFGYTGNPYQQGVPFQGLNQSPLAAPSVFNFFSPSYRLNKGNIDGIGKVQPEMQLVNETSSASYVNAMLFVCRFGFGGGGNRISLNVSAEVATNAAASVTANINQKLFGNTMSTALQSYITNAFSLASASGLSFEEKVRYAILLAVTSPEFAVQK